jgi:hypothetical protein
MSGGLVVARSPIFESAARVSSPPTCSLIVVDDTVGTDASRWLNNDGIEKILSRFVRGLFDMDSSKWFERRL